MLGTKGILSLHVHATPVVAILQWILRAKLTIQKYSRGIVGAVISQTGTLFKVWLRETRSRVIQSCVGNAEGVRVRASSQAALDNLLGECLEVGFLD